MSWFDLPAVQGTLKSLLQHHSSKASVFGAQFSLWSNSQMYRWFNKLRAKNQPSEPIFSSVKSFSHVRLFDAMDCSTLGLPVHHQLPESSQTHAYQVGDAIQPSHLLSSPSPPAFNLSQHQGLFQGVSSLHQVAKVLEFQVQHKSFE